MTKTMHARFDGTAFYPEEPVSIAPNTTVILTVETEDPPLKKSTDFVPTQGEPYSFLKLAMSLNLEGPEDWSENLDGYLYGDKKLPDD